MNTTKKLLSLILALTLCLGVFCACSKNNEPTTPSFSAVLPSDTEKKVVFVFTVTDKDGKKDDHIIRTSEKYLADALIEEGLLNADEKASGLYTVIGGIVASWDDENAWWKILKDGEMTDVGMNELPVSDGARYEAVYTVGY